MKDISKEDLDELLNFGGLSLDAPNEDKVSLKVFAVDYTLDGEVYSIDLVGLDMEDAQKRLQAIKETGEITRLANYDIDTWENEGGV